MVEVKQMDYRIPSLHLTGLAMLLCAGLAAAQTSPVPEIQIKPAEQQSISAIAVSPDGAALASARYSPDGGEVRLGKNDSIDLWLLRSASSPHSFARELHPIRSLAFSHDSQWLSAASQGLETITDERPGTEIFVGKVYLWHVADSAQSKLKWDIRGVYAVQGTYDEWSATSVAFSPDNKQVVIDVFVVDDLPRYDERIFFFDIATGRAVNSTELDDDYLLGFSARRFSWLSPDGRRAFVLRGNKPAFINTLSGRRVQAFAPSQMFFHPSDQDSCALGIYAFGFTAFAPDMRQMAIANDDELEIRDAKTGAIKVQTTLDRNSDVMRSFAAAFSPDGSSLAVSRCGPKSEIGLYETAKLKLRARLPVESVQTSMQYAADGALLFTGGFDGTVRVWDTQRGSLVATLARRPNDEWIVFTPDGLYDASANGASLLAWRLKDQIVLASKLADMRLPGLLSKLVSGEHPKPTKPLIVAISHALTHIDP
jgi:WD40 repeat protein